MPQADVALEGWERDIGHPAWWARVLLFAAVAGGLVGLIGFVSGDLLICLFDWTGMIVVGTLIAAALLPRLIRIGRRIGLPLDAAMLGAIVVTALPIGFFAALFSAWAWPKEVGRLSPADWYLRTLLVEGLVVSGWAMLEYSRQLRVAGRQLAQAPPPCLPARTESDVICLQMEDHYVRVHRARSSSIELMPMKVAIQRYGSPDGQRVHRSWWVRSSAVRQIAREGRNVRLVLDGGLVVPVARNSIGQLRHLKLPD